ncbi:hypothetical protein ABID26_007240 [Mesorhizobium shonense]|uniref:Uncharacterized protein n=1 Tax=Mesorhizobium shonense TaxID=1209948 RepID=A0ABV2I4K0_9HYPH
MVPRAWPGFAHQAQQRRCRLAQTQLWHDPPDDREPDLRRRLCLW